MSGESQTHPSEYIPSQTGGSTLENESGPSLSESKTPLEEPLIAKPQSVATKSKRSKVVKKRAAHGSKSRNKRRLEGRIRKLAGRSHPLDKTGLFGAIFYTWVKPFLWIGNRTSFLQSMHADVPKRDSIAKNERNLFEMYKRKGSIGKSIISLYIGTILKNFFLMAICQFCLCLLSVLMYILLLVATDDSIGYDMKTRYYIYLFSGLIGCQIIGAILKNYIYCDLSRLSVRLKNGVIFAIYKKLMKISVLNPSEHTEGNILNYINVDAQKLEDSITKLSLLMESIWLIVFGFSICIYLVSFNIVVCVVVFFTFTYLSTCLYKVIFKYEVQFMIAKDKRTTLLKNVITNVKYIKTRCWENFYHAKIFVNRNIELSAMKKSNFVFVAIVTLGWFTPSLSYLATFLSMCYFKQPLEIAKILAYVRIFVSILKGIGNIPTVVQFFIELKVSLNRLNVYFDAAEINSSYVVREEQGSGVFAIEMDLGNFYWNKLDEKFMKKRRERSRKRRVKIRKYGNTMDEGKMVTGNHSVRSVSVMKSTVSRFTGTTNTTQGSKISLAPTLNESLMSLSAKEKVGFQLMDVDMLIRKGELVMIFGGIGSGKSSILYSMLNEMNPKYSDPQPKLKIQGDVLYVGQKPWLLNMSIKDNIVLDRPFDEEMLERAINLSALDSDIAMFDEGVERVLTDGASNLSGGQRTRVALARAIYQNPDIYLFDDPLSALDGNVGEFLMETTITKELKGSTRIIVTHALHFLKYADKIFYVDDGRITFKGNYKMLKEEKFFKSMMKTKKEEEEKKKEDDKKKPKAKKEVKPKKVENEVRKLEVEGPVKENALLRLFAKEDRSKGRLSCKVLHTFIKNTGGYLFFFFYCILSGCGAFLQFEGVLFLLGWANKYNEDERWDKLKILTAIICGYCTLALIRYYSYMALGVKLSRRIHANMIFRVLHAPVEEFLELVPKGRILNRFTKDINTIDKVLIKVAVLAIFKLIQFFVSFYFMAKSLNIGICFVLTFFFLCSIWIQNRSMNLKREIIRLEAISKSPIVTWASQTTKGLAQIRSTFKQKWFVGKMSRLIESNLKNSILVYGLDSWFQLRISMLNVFLVQLPAFSFIIWNFNGRPIPLELVALFLILSTALTDDILAVLQSLSEFEASLISIERCEFFNNIPPEALYRTVKQEEKKFMLLPPKIKPSSLCLKQTHKIIPQGNVVFENVTARYGEDAEPVLKNLTFEVKPGEKVGIVGRTGAGKSSLIKLFWLSLRPSNGRIIIDGTDITQVDLKELRNEVMIVSQESALFLGTLRENIDPTSGTEKDPELIMALDKLGFKNKNVIEKGLDYRVDAGGANFSQGERQVICFSRTLINKRKLIVLDEATANIDITTEQHIQKVQETEFSKSTMFIIAHRINTVMNCDKIMVLKFGELMEFDSPENLLQNEDSYFKQIYDKMMEQNEGM